MLYLGDYPEDATVYFPFTTNAADGGRESLSASLEEADITIYKNGTALTLTAGTITVTANPGSQVGVYLVSIDMSNDTDFTTGAEYTAILYPSDETVDSQSIAAPLAVWSCERASGPVVTFERLGAPAGASVSADIATVDTVVDRIEVDTQDLQTQVGTAGAGLTAVPWNSAWEAEVQGDVTASLNAYDPPTKTEMDAAFTEIKGATWASGTDTLEHIRNKQTDIETDTQDLQTQVGTAGAGLSAIPWNASWDTEVQSEVTDALNAYDPPTRAELTSDLAALNDVSAAEVLTQVNAALDTAIAELGVGAPTATPSLRTGLMLLYMMARNRVDVDTTGTDAMKIYDNSGTQIASKAITDDGTDYSEAEMS